MPLTISSRGDFLVAKYSGPFSGCHNISSAFPTVTELRGKLAAHEELFLRSQPTQMLWFTTSPGKSTRLEACIRDADWRDYFWVGLVDDASPLPDQTDLVVA